MTLIEILIVLAIVSMVMSLGLPSLQRVTYQQINSTTRKFVGVVRTVRNDSILLNSIHRLAFNLDENKWWVETQDSQKLLESSDLVAAYDKEGKVITKRNGFSINPKYSKDGEANNLPNGVVISKILKESEGLVEKGLVYIHIFPNGSAEHSILYLKRSGSDEISYSVLIRPTGGRVDVINGEEKAFPL